MKIFFKKYLPHLVSLFIIFAPVILLADPATTIKNPLKSNDVNKILVDIMNMVALVGGVVVVFMIIYSGFNYVTAGGDEGKVKKASEMLWATVIGGAILLGADVIANVVVNTVNATVGKKGL